MARQKRALSSTGIYHILLRGENDLFLDKKDYEEFLLTLKKYFSLETQKLYAYALSEKKIHLVINVCGGEIAKIMKPICTSYARYFNRTHSREGKLFYDRYKSEPIESEEALLNVVVYVNKNTSKSSLSEYLNLSYICDTNHFYDKIGGQSIYEHKMSSNISQLFIDDYERMPKKEIEIFIKELCSYNVKEIKKLDKETKKQVLEILKSQTWISGKRLSEILELDKSAIDRLVKPKPRTITKAENDIVVDVKEEEMKKSNNTLSVWLL